MYIVGRMSRKHPRSAEDLSGDEPPSHRPINAVHVHEELSHAGTHGLSGRRGRTRHAGRPGSRVFRPEHAHLERQPRPDHQVQGGTRPVSSPVHGRHNTGGCKGWIGSINSVYKQRWGY